MQLLFLYSLCVDTANFKDFMSLIPASVSVVGLVKKSQIYGCTISSLVSLNVVNPELLFVLRNGSGMLNVLGQQEPFSINVLSDGQRELAEFYSSKREIESFASSSNPWKETNFGSIVLEASRISFVCRLKRKEELETSTLIFCTPEAAIVSAGASPLIYSGREFFRISKFNQD